MIKQTLLLLFVYLIQIITLRINTKPHVSKYKNHLPLFWKIANKNEFPYYKPKRYLFNGYPIAIYKDYNNNITNILAIFVSIEVRHFLMVKYYQIIAYNVLIMDGNMIKELYN